MATTQGGGATNPSLPQEAALGEGLNPYVPSRSIAANRAAPGRHVTGGGEAGQKYNYVGAGGPSGQPAGTSGQPTGGGPSGQPGCHCAEVNPRLVLTGRLLQSTE